MTDDSHAHHLPTTDLEEVQLPTQLLHFDVEVILANVFRSR